MIDFPLSNTIINYIYIYLFIFSVITFLLFGIDKYKAVKYSRDDVNRISEKTLLLWSFLGGTIGSIAGMILFRHKIKKVSFLIKFFVVLLVQFGIIYFSIKGQ